MDTLDQILRYSNPRVISKFRECYFFDNEESQAIFQDLLRWLWLTSTAPPKVKCAMYHSMLALDKMWHVFLSHTKDYAQFCEAHLGTFVHHEPHTREETVRSLIPNTKNRDPLGKTLKGIEAFQSYTYDKLGSDTLIRWFITYPHAYSPEELLRRTRPQFSERGFMRTAELRRMSKKKLLKELAPSREIAAYCGGPSCGPYCMECSGGGGGGKPPDPTPYS